jgi:hypothetical protein
MKIIGVELHSAITNSLRSPGARIAKIGNSEKLSNYATEMLRGQRAEDLNKGIDQHSTFIEKPPPSARHL